MKAGIISLGCSKNLVDTEIMLGILREKGIELVQESEKADILIVNTCAFIETAKTEAITTVLSLAENKINGCCKSLIVAGCLGQRYGEELLTELPEVDAIVGAGEWNRIAEAIDETLKGNRVVFVGEPKLLYNAKMPRIMTTPPYTAYVKIAEGCDNRCAFCAIPYIRGRYRSRTIEDICEEVRTLAENGVKEINLTAQDTTRYGLDIYGEVRLAALLKELAKIGGIKWIRILYAYPRFFTDELIETIASEEKICKYIDLPLQHAHDSVLKSMRRPDTREGIEALLDKIRSKIPNVTVRTTFIVGFPGETDAQYQTLRRFIEKQSFDKVGIFTYSPEEGTPAFDMPNRIDEDVRQERYHDLMSLQSKISEDINQKLEGKELDVLIEGYSDEEENIAYGRSYREAPDVDGQVFVEEAGSVKPGDIIRVKILQGFTYDVVGEPVK